MTPPETIFALASARGRAGVAVIRVSGPASDTALGALLAGPLPAYRQASLRRLRHPVSRETLDDALVLRFAEGASFTGEASAELHCHGGPAVVRAVLDALATLPGLRPALPGEFTRRAFEGGRLDLAQIEGLADLIHAETEGQRRAAQRQADGGLGALCRDWSAGLTRCLALLEASIDFADEEIPDDLFTDVMFHVKQLAEAMAATLEGAGAAERLRDGWRVALIGAPNAGKSSLVNALARRDVAIVSEIAGTTRDSLEVQLDLRGFPVTVVDTAGLRETGDAIEREGVLRSRRMAAEADLVLALHAPDAPLDAMPASEAPILTVWNKGDLASPPDGADLAISAKSGAGLDTLIERIAERLSLAEPPPSQMLLRERQRAAIVEAHALLRALEDEPATAMRERPEIAAETLRAARDALGRITGETGVESLLDVIFSEFCLGK